MDKLLSLPYLRAALFLYFGGVFARISLTPGVQDIVSDVILLSLGIIGGVFMAYGIIVFIGDLKKSSSISDIKKEISKNIKRAKDVKRR